MLDMQAEQRRQSQQHELFVRGLALQQAQLEANTSEIEQMKQLLGGGACCEFVLASRSLILGAIRLSAMHPGPSCD